MTGTQRHSSEDLALLAELGTLLDRLDPVPDKLYAAAYETAVLIGSGQDVESLELIDDSTVDSQPAGVRGAVGRRMLGFEGEATDSPRVCVRLELSGTGDRTRRLYGMLTPATEGTVVTLRWRNGSSESVVDCLGVFDIDAVPAGPMRLEISPPAAPRMLSRWFIG